MLRIMQESAAGQASSMSSDFAGLLAALTASKAADRPDARPWSGSDLDEDVVSLSEARALRARAQYLGGEAGSEGDRWHGDGAGGGVAAAEELRAGTGAGAARDRAGVDAATGAGRAAEADCDRRTSSITIRLSQAECAQIHRRAAEAGLTVSSFLRSCVLEAEALRAQVKQALAELKAESAGGRQHESAQAGRSVSEGIRLRRVLARIGRLWVGIASGDAG